MDGYGDEVNGAIGRRVRLEREARGWSLADLAQHSGVSKAAIGKIEHGDASPTAVVLVRLASAFDLTLAGLILRAEDAPRIARADEQPVWRDPATGYRRRQVLARPDHPVEIVDVSLPAGQRVDMPAASYARIRQAVRVEAGRLVIVEGGQRHELGPGDCLAFGPPAEVAFVNATDSPCDYLVVLARS